jgi:hypothetical protein
MLITANPVMTSLNGLQRLEVANYVKPDFQGLIITANDVLTSPAAFRGLSRAAGCPWSGYGPPPFTGSTIAVVNSSCDLRTYAALCRFIAGTC